MLLLNWSALSVTSIDGKSRSHFQNYSETLLEMNNNCLNGCCSTSVLCLITFWSTRCIVIVKTPAISSKVVWRSSTQNVIMHGVHSKLHRRSACPTSWNTIKLRSTRSAAERWSFLKANIILLQKNCCYINSDGSIREDTGAVTNLTRV